MGVVNKSMNYSGISECDVLNGTGFRVVLFVSSCSHRCYNCQNPKTWDKDFGCPFTEETKKHLLEYLRKPYIDGLTLTGGDPLHENNLEDILLLIDEIRTLVPKKTIWLYTGYTWEEIFAISYNEDFVCQTTTDKNTIYRQNIIRKIDVLIDGRYVDELRDVTLKFRGSSNQRLIDVKKSLEENAVVLCEEKEK